MPILLLIRHGQNDCLKKHILAGRMPAVHLNKHGRAQAERLAEELDRLPICSIFTSPLERAVETANPLARRKGLPILHEPNLSETDIGRWEGRSIKSLRHTKTWQEIQQAPALAAFPGGETFQQAQARVVQALEKIRRSCKRDDLIAIFFHADPIKLAIAYYLGLPLDHFQRLTIDPCSVTILGFRENKVQLLGLNLGNLLEHMLQD